MRDPALAARELERVARLGCHSVFGGAAPHNGKSFGDPIWAAAQDLDIAIGLHLVGHAHYPGGEFFRGRDPGFIWMTMNVISHLVEAANYRRAEARGAGHQLRPALPHS